MKTSNYLPLLFVFLWSSAYIAFEYCSAYVEPATFVVIRTTLTANILLLIIACTKSGWFTKIQDVIYSAIVGILIHGFYAGGLFMSIYNGIDVGLCALILSLQPLLTVLLSSTFLGEQVTARKMFGIVAGLAGVFIVILEGSTLNSAPQSLNAPQSGNNVFSVAMSFLALFAISVATIVQKRYCTGTSLLSGACIQYTAAAIFMLPLALLFETMQIEWAVELVLGLSWLVVFISIGAVTLLMLLIKHGEAGAVANLFYLVTPLVALEAWLLFGDELTFVSLVGMAICVSGVVAVNGAPTIKGPQRAIFGTARINA